MEQSISLPALHAFVDEAGDEGMDAHCDPWIVMAAIVMLESETNSVRDVLADGIQKIWAPGKHPRDASFKRTPNPKRKALLQLLKRVNSLYFAVLANKQLLTPTQRTRLQCPKLYHFMAKHLVERLTWYGKEQGLVVNITFGARKQIKFENLKKYLTVTLRQQNQSFKSHYIDYRYLGALRESRTASSVLLQSADWVASGLAQGLNVDQHGNTEDRYTELMWGRFWINKGKLWGCGLKCIPEVDHKKYGLLNKIDTWLDDPTALV